MLERQRPSPHWSALDPLRDLHGKRWLPVSFPKVPEASRRLLGSVGTWWLCTALGVPWSLLSVHSSALQRSRTVCVLVHTKHILQHPPASSAMAATTASGSTACVTATVYSSCPTAAATKARACARLRAAGRTNKQTNQPCARAAVSAARVGLGWGACGSADGPGGACIRPRADVCVRACV